MMISELPVVVGGRAWRGWSAWQLAVDGVARSGGKLPE
jgi:hypothetical protein